MSLRTEFHTELLARTRELCVQLADQVETEYQLPNGKIADIIYRTSMNDIVIVEVKTFLAQEMITQTLRKYDQYANYLIMAVPEHDYHRHTAPTGIIGQFSVARNVGWIAIRDDKAILRSIGTRRRIAPSLTGLSRGYTDDLAETRNEPIPHYRK